MSQYSKLQLAIIKDTETNIMKILQENVDLNVTDVKGNSLLHLAFRNKKFNEKQLIGILEILLNKGVDINVKNKQEMTILHLAIEHRMSEVIDLCLRKNADLKVKDKSGNSLAHFVVEQESSRYQLFMKDPGNWSNLAEFEIESSSFVKCLLSRGFDFFYTKNKDGKSPLYLTNDLDLHHILLTLLKHIDDLSTLEKNQTSLICAFFKRKNNVLFADNDIRVNHLFTFPNTFNIVKTILEKNKSIDDDTMNMALTLAIDNKERKDVVIILAKYIAKINIDKDSEKSKDKMAVARALIPKGADINKKDGPSGRTLASTLFRYNPTIEMLHVLKEIEADFNTSTSSNNFLHDMIYVDDNISGVGKLIEFLVNDGGCNVNRPNNRGETPLKGAIAHSKIDIVKKLIKYGAEINRIDEYGETPFEVVCSWDHLEIVKILIEYGIDLQFRDKNDRTYLYIAAKHGAVNVIQLLICNGVNVNVKDKNGKTAVHLAGTKETVRILFSSGAVVDMFDKNGNTPIDDALSRRNFNVVQELLKYSADIMDSKIFKLTLDYYTYRTYDDSHYQLFPCMKQHLVKLITLGFYSVNPCLFKEYYVQKLFKECEVEVELLKTYFLDECTSIYNFLHKNRNRRCAYADNEKLKNLVKDRAIEQRFPNYFILILGSFNDAVTRKSLLEQASHVLLQLTDIFLPDLCLDKILMYLNNVDILHFIEAYKGEC